MSLRQKLGNNLKEYRKAKGWSQEHLAFEAGLHRTYISELERGRKNCSIDVLEKLAEALDIEARQLI